MKSFLCSLLLPSNGVYNWNKTFYWLVTIYIDHIFQVILFGNIVADYYATHSMYL